MARQRMISKPYLWMAQAATKQSRKPGKGDQDCLCSKSLTQGSRKRWGCSEQKEELCCSYTLYLLVTTTICESILRRMDQSDQVLGGSCFAIFDGTGVKYSLLNAVRSVGRILLRFHGTSSGFFVRRRVFLAANGFRADVMEEAVYLQRRISSWGRFISLSQYVTSSSRRFRSRRTFIPTVAVWTTTVFPTALGLHFTSIQKKSLDGSEIGILELEL